MKIKAEGNLYPFPTRSLTLGEQRKLKREFGFVPGRDELDLRDPDHLGAFLFAAMRSSDEDAPASALFSFIERVREIEIVDDDGKPLTDDTEKPDPTPAETPTEAGDEDASS